MPTNTFRKAALLLAAPGLALAMPAGAAPAAHAPVAAHHEAPVGTMTFEHGKKKGWDRGRGNPHRYHDYGRRDHHRVYYDEPIYRDTRIWRGNDGRYYCRKEDGTTGLLIGAAVGGLIGHEVAGRGGDRTLGAILGAAGGAILGRSIDRNDSRCR